MSRCFPYPPPNFDEALIESVKKERERTKNERRKEEKRAKKEKKKASQQKENSENVKHGSRKRKYQTDSQVTETSNDLVEQLEKSGLTEEQELPHSSQTGYDSPERSQDSSKRRKLSSASPSHCNNGTVLRIKLPSFKTREPGQSAILSVVQSTVPGQGTIVKEGVPQSSTVIRQSKLQLPAKVPQIEQRGPQFPARVPQIDCSTTLKGQENVVRPAFKFNLKAADPAQPACKLKHEVRDSDTAVAKQKNQPSKLKFEIKDSVPSATKQKQLSKPKLEAKDSDAEAATQKQPSMLKLEARDLNAAAAKQKQVSKLELRARDSDTAPGKQSEKHVSGEPCFSGRETGTTLDGEVAGAVHNLSSSGGKSSGSRRERKFRDLIVDWNPPPLQFEDSSIDDQDWLFGTTKRQISNSNPNTCGASGEPQTDRGNDINSSLQPRACYLPDLDMYQLPYIVPF